MWAKARRGAAAAKGGHIMVDLTLSDSTMRAASGLEPATGAATEGDVSSTPACADDLPGSTTLQVTAAHEAGPRVTGGGVEDPAASTEGEGTEPGGQESPQGATAGVGAAVGEGAGLSGAPTERDASQHAAASDARPAGGGGAEGGLASLVALGFSRDQAKRALQMGGNNVERAANWLYNTS